MTINLLPILQGALGNQLVDQLAGIAGIDAGGARKAVTAFLPTILGSLISNASTPQGVGQLGNLLKQGDPNLIANIGNVLQDPNGSGRLLSSGKNLLSGILGNKEDGILDSLSNFSGLNQAGLGSLLGLVTPLILSVLGKQQQTLGLDAGGFAKLILGQKEFLKGALPPGMNRLLGVSAPGSVAQAATPTVNSAAKPARAMATKSTAAIAGQSNKGFLKLLVPIVLIIAVAFLAWKFLFNDRATGGSNLPGTVTMDNALTSAKGIFNETTSTLKSITDVESAKAAVPRLDSINQAASSLVALKENLSGEAKEKIVSEAKKYVPQYDQMVKKAYAIPGVQDIIEPKINRFMEIFDSFGN